MPLVLLTGFLGSGKTTLVNRLLARRAARRETRQLGVIVNELGEIGIDGALIRGGASRQVELPGGCVCCVLGDDLDRTLIELLDANPDLEAIVLETTGVAEPLPIAWALAREPVASRVRLAAVVATVDATHFHASRPLSVAVDAQVAYADVLLVTKSELVEPASLRALEAEIRTLTSRGLVQIHGTDEHAAWLETILEDPVLEHSSPDGEAPDHVHDEHCRHPDNGSAHGIDSVWVSVDGVVDLEELEDQLAELPPNYVRIKGIAEAIDGRTAQTAPRWVVVHRVGPRVSSEPLDADRVGGVRQGRLVALGTQLQRAMLEACIDAARG